MKSCTYRVDWPEHHNLQEDKLRLRDFRLSVYVTKEEMDAVADAANRQGVSANALMRKAIRKALGMPPVDPRVKTRGKTHATSLTGYRRPGSGGTHG